VFTINYLCVFFSWEMALNSISPMYRSVICRTGKEYGTKQRKLLHNILSLFSLSATIFTPLSFSSTSLHVSAAPGHLQVMMSCSTVTLYTLYLFL
jgi:hypothetical protein